MNTTDLNKNTANPSVMLTLGIHDNPAGPAAVKGFGDLQILEGMQSGQVRLVCPPGSLARLPQRHAYARLRPETSLGYLRPLVPRKGLTRKSIML
jgi:hypothetical protein